MLNRLVPAVFTLIGLSIVAGASAFLAAGTALPSGPPGAMPSSGPIVAELFTSEGCSSCPSADDLLVELQRASPVPPAEIIVLSEHVDYWNRLGWADPFSSRTFSERQAAYSRRFGADRIYTPQLVIDGLVEAVGSDRHTVVSGLHRAATRAHGRLRLEVASVDGALDVAVVVDGLPPDAGSGLALMLAVTEDDLSTKVQRGENGGRTLHHTGVVRRLERIGAVGGDDTGRRLQKRVSLDGAWRRDRLRVVAFVQVDRAGEIVAAQAVALDRSSPTLDR